MTGIKSRSRITLGVPVYRGWNLVPETLRSIQDQTYQDYSVLISVDGCDKRSRDVCLPFLSDSRFRLVMQEARLGWAGNINWLMTQCDTDFFCYYQQDDLTAKSYLETLIKEADRYPDAAAVFSDLKFFGDREGVVSGRSITGDAFARVLMQLETFFHGPSRGLIRLAAVREAGAMRNTEDECFAEDLVWLIRLAQAGELRRVPAVLYYKRRHAAHASKDWFERWPPSRRRAALIVFCEGLLSAALPVARSMEERFQLLFAVLERLALHQWFYETNRLTADERRLLVVDFLFEVKRVHHSGWPDQFGLNWTSLTNVSLRRFALRGVASSAVNSPSVRSGEKLSVLDVAHRLLKDKLHYRIGDEIDFSDENQSRRFMQGEWGGHLEWGVWTHGRLAELTIWPENLDADGLSIQAFVKPFLRDNQNRKRVQVMIEDRPVAEWKFDIADPDCDHPRWCEASIATLGRAPAVSQPIRIAFRVEDLPLPSSLGLPPDAPVLGLGFLKLRIESARLPAAKSKFRPPDIGHQS